MLRSGRRRAGVCRRKSPENPTVGRAGRADDDPMAASVMVVDDDDRFRSLANRILADCGFRPESEARTVAEALQQVTQRIPDLALVDVDLPDGNGLELSKQLTAPPWGVRVVLVSVDSDAVTPKDAAAAGAVGFLPKSDLSCASLRALLDDPLRDG